MKFLRFTLLLASFFLLANAVHSQAGRMQVSIDDNWKFKKGGYDFANMQSASDADWQRISLPHTWNATDPFDDDATYYRGICWYRKHLTVDKELLKKEVFLYFEGANQVADIYVNGAFVGKHNGGYTAFSFDISSYLKAGENLIAVQVNNAQDYFIPPISVGYAMYGGIYRDVWLVATEKTHFDMNNYGSNGVFINTPNVSAKAANVRIRGGVTNDQAFTKTVEIQNYIYDPQHILKATNSKTVTIAPKQKVGFDVQANEINDPQLWSPEHPALYTVVSRVVEQGKVVDEVTNNLGFRWFKFDPATGFSLNGSKYILHGTNRHQDIEGKGSALTSEDHERDFEIIKKMGANFVRLAHYPQAPEVLRLADKMGIIIWEEIPIVNNMNVDPAFLENGKNMIREMVRQHYNHPSVMIWGSMNEVLLWSKGSVRIQEHDDTTYVNGVHRYAVKLDSTVRAEDPSRYSTMAMHWSEDYEKFNFSNVTQIAGWNIYNGWYSGNTADFGTLLRKKHAEHPKEVLLISEYGAESDKQVNSEHPQRLDFSGQYQRYYHEEYLRQINTMPFLAATAVWNEFDFSQPNVGGTISHMNHKGMVTWDRQPKDVYYFYKANWNPEPMVYIASRDWQYRSGHAGELSTIEVYANGKTVQLSVNGHDYGSTDINDVNKASWKVMLRPGDNNVEASTKVNGKFLTDHYVIHYFDTDDAFREGNLSVNVGSNTQYTDKDQHVWVEDQPYKKGSYGWVGGIPCTLNIKTLITYTQDTPLFYSYQKGIEAYKADVPDGIYEVELCFTEPEKCKKEDRVFNVEINGQAVLDALDLYDSAGTGIAVVKKFRTNVVNGQGITMNFKALKGKSLLSGLKIRKL